VRYTTARDRVEETGFTVGWGDGKFVLVERHAWWWGESLDDGRAFAAAHGAGRHWSAELGIPRFTTVNPKGGMRRSEQLNDLSCWVVALLAGAWPLISIGRARHRQRRVSRIGCCVHCGYDLRATPGAGGELMTRCPECGISTSGDDAVR
jgi:hypothetical protein